jgi:hypothetical protein
MVEGLREQDHNRRVGSLVLGVARAAESRGASGEAAMKPERGLDVEGDRFVTREAEVVLGAPIEALMTGAAVLCLALVSGDERARGHQALDIYRAHRSRNRNCSYENKDGGKMFHCCTAP